MLENDSSATILAYIIKLGYIIILVSNVRELFYLGTELKLF
jgi:hypothetical protein